MGQQPNQGDLLGQQQALVALTPDGVKRSVPPLISSVVLLAPSAGNRIGYPPPITTLPALGSEKWEA